MHKPLAAYLHDHLSGAEFAVDLLESMQSDYAGKELGEFAAELNADVEADRQTLRDIADDIGDSSSGLSLKEAVGWTAEKMTWLKLRRTASGELGPLLVLETLAVGIHGKLALWKALRAIADTVPRLAVLDFDRLDARAEDQRRRVEAQRLKAARSILITE